MARVPSGVVAKRTQEVSLDAQDNVPELVLDAEVTAHKPAIVVRLCRYRRCRIPEVHLRPLVARAHTEVEATPVRWPLIHDLTLGRVAISQHCAGAAKCRRGRDD